MSNMTGPDLETSESSMNQEHRKQENNHQFKQIAHAGGTRAVVSNMTCLEIIGNFHRPLARSVPLYEPDK
jgi:hypothetical protein